jgi:phosphatidylinositol-4,5-bisphosphate 3-kinase
MLLHKHAKLFISLFTMMLCMGIPELERLEDVNFLRRTLAADMSEQEALAYFQHQLNEAYEGGWTTKTNWFFHSVRHL